MIGNCKIIKMYTLMCVLICFVVDVIETIMHLSCQNSNCN